MIYVKSRTVPVLLIIVFIVSFVIAQLIQSNIIPIADRNVKYYLSMSLLLTAAIGIIGFFIFIVWSVKK